MSGGGKGWIWKGAWVKRGRRVWGYRKGGGAGVLRGSGRWGGTWALLRLLGTQRMVRLRGISWVELPTEEGTGGQRCAVIRVGEGGFVWQGGLWREEVWGCLLSKKDLKRGEGGQRAGCWQRVKGARTRGASDHRPGPWRRLSRSRRVWKSKVCSAASMARYRVCSGAPQKWSKRAIFCGFMSPLIPTRKDYVGDS